MLCMVGEIVARLRVREDRQWAAIERQPLRDITEDLRRNGELNAPARVRADGAQVEVTDTDGEASLGSRRKLLGLFDLFRIIVDVGVEIANGGLGHSPLIA